MTFANTLQSNQDISAALPRSKGRVEISFEHDGATSCLKHLYQSGCGRVRFPLVEEHHCPEAVLINTSGGLTGGDVMSFDVTLHENTELTVSGQAAEKIYKSIGPMVKIEARLDVQDGAYLEWLPQETILFDQARLQRVNKVALTKNSRLLAVEATILGRLAHGEVVREASLVDGWEIMRDGKMIWFDRFRFEGNMHDVLGRSALMDGATSFATLVVAAPDADQFLQIARAAEQNVTSRMGSTALEDDLVIIRLLDKDPQSLRKNLVYIIQQLREKMHGSALSMPAAWEV